MKLAIISHTPHYKKKGKISGWGSTVREVNHLLEIFDEIYHIAPLHNEDPPDSSIEYQSDKIKFISLKPYGGEDIRQKFSILFTAPYNLKKINLVLKKFDREDWVQFRAPTAMGLYVLPFLKIMNKSKLWVKYAGNWKMEDPPLSYRFQKWWLENNYQGSKVTINGYWEGQKAHILDFQNPCFDKDELDRAGKTGAAKNFEGKLTLCFAGSLTANKGVDILLDALKMTEAKNDIEEMIFAGDGSERKKYEKAASEINMKISFAGLLSRSELEKVYEKSHLIVLPSQSEGFPKVIAEAAAFGCVPVVSDVSSISQYFDETKSFLLKNINAVEIRMKLDFALSNRKKLKEMSLLCIKASGIFTYEHYMNSLRDKIIFAD
jgi:glycosyltransferase involved in cell wall biosynthesis